MVGQDIRNLLLDGKSNRAIRESLGVAASTISYHARKLGLEKTLRPSYDWGPVQDDVLEGRSVSELCEKYGFAKATYQRAVSDGRIRRPRRKNEMSLTELSAFLDGRRAVAYDRKLLRRLLIDECGVVGVCANCGISEWMGQRICLEVDHIDGNPRHNAVKNLRLLCPNCHSITDTWRGRNQRK